MSNYHNPVLLHESLEALAIRPDGTYVDVTFGGGGHSRAILAQLGEKGKLIAFDQDEDAGANIINDPRFILVKQNFRFLKNLLRLHSAIPVDGILADLGISSHQIDQAERGFSTRFDGPLDMRMNRSATMDAEEVLNNYDERQLRNMFREFGDVENAAKLSKTIFAAREEVSIRSIAELKAVISSCMPKGKEFQYLAKVFQALRIEINGEMEALKELLLQSVEVLKPEGRMVVISYHSLEDRLVKNYFRTGSLKGEQQKDFFGNIIRPFEPVNRKPIVPSESELNLNNRSRSAKLRIATKSA
ncbi:MAG: 16S rRNA (cytosine(1402)-N(4))-methyltransferase RsmH [Bacteroidetes bacterium]|nr:16S rRNA (cytosine(1402)-N(4))-methyltransferase RsmH [Bacteroidota bacterium]PHX82187.1 MAG: 16S rRNA (cytosine(1402)-N(4))-methyltransferase [Flavobacteriales bacterium]